jgi:hypothetical protein
LEFLIQSKTLILSFRTSQNKCRLLIQRVSILPVASAP